VIVTAVNADGRTSAPSDTTETVSAKGGPTVSVEPVVSGTAQVGEELSSTTGTWAPATATTSRQWQRCDADGAACRNIAGATGRTYGVRTADNGHRVRVRVAARTSGGVAYAASDPTAVVGGGTTTSTVTTTVQGNKPPTIVFVSLRRAGVRVYARFRVCDDKLGRLTVIERDNKTRALSYMRRFRIVRAASWHVLAQLDPGGALPHEGPLRGHAPGTGRVRGAEPHREPVARALDPATVNSEARPLRRPRLAARVVVTRPRRPRPLRPRSRRRRPTRMRAT
jgi:hypothetical protein